MQQDQLIPHLPPKPSRRLVVLAIILTLLLPFAEYATRVAGGPTLTLLEPAIFGLIVAICAGGLLSAKKIIFNLTSKLLLLLLLLYLLLTTLDPSGAKHVSLIGIVLLLHTFLSNFQPTLFQLKILRRAALLFLIAMASLYLIASTGVQKNTAGSYCLAYLLAYYSFEMRSPNRSNKTMLIILPGTALFLAHIDFRGGILQCIIIAAAILYEGARLPAIRPLPAFLGSIATLAAAIFIFAYMDDFYYYQADLASSIENLSDRTIASGRNIIWPLAIEYILDKPVFGNGTGFLLRSVADFSWSTHNTFLQIALQSGLIGAALVLSIFYAAYRHSHLANRESRSKQIRATAIIFCIFTYNVFEASLLQNSMPIALIHWLCIASTLRATNSSLSPTPEASHQLPRSISYRHTLRSYGSRASDYL